MAAYLEKHLKVPFRAVVEEYQRGPVRQGDQVTVMGITGMDDTYGTIVAVKHKRGVHELPVRAGLVNAGKREKSERRAGERETKKVAERGKRRGSYRPKRTEKIKRNRRIESLGQMGANGGLLRERKGTSFGERSVGS